MTQIATQCVEQLEELLKKIPDVRKVIHVYDEQELLDKTKGMLMASKDINVGILYEGMKENQRVQGSATTVVSTQLVVSLIISGKPDALYGSHKTGMAYQLDQTRTALKGKKAPTNHIWRFMVEAPAVLKEDAVVWIQRWSTACNV